MRWKRVCLGMDSRQIKYGLVKIYEYLVEVLINTEKI